MQLKRLFACILVTFSALLMSCEKDGAVSSKPVEIIILNNSNDQIKKIEIGIKDGDIWGAAIEGSKMVVLELQDISPNSVSAIKEIKLKDFSASGEGRITVNAVLSNGSILSTGLGFYKNYTLHSEFAPSSWQTAEVRFEQATPNSSISISANIAKYENGIFVKRY